MRDDGKALAGVEFASIVLRKADTLTPVTEKTTLSPSHIQANGYFSHARLQREDVE